MSTNLDDLFQSKYLKSSDLPDDGTTQPFTIRSIRVEEIGREKEKKPVIYFDESDKGLVCNVVNKNTIKAVHGTTDIAELKGKVINLYATEVEFGGDMVMAIRVKLKNRKPAGEAVKRPLVVQNQTADDMDEDSDSIPF